MVRRTKSLGTGDDIYLLTSSWQGEDMFQADGVGFIYTTDKAREWLEQRVGEYMAFEKARTQEG